MPFENFFPKGRFGRSGESNRNIFVSSGPCFTLDADEEKVWLLRTPAEPYVFFVFEFQSSRNGEINNYRNPTITTPGALCVCDNNNDNIDDTPQLQVYHEPTYSDVGTNFFSVVVGTDGDPANNIPDVGGNYNRRRGRILRRDTDYLLSFKSLADNNRVSHLFTFAEES